MSPQKLRRFGSGWHSSDKPAALSESPSATGRIPPVGRCGNRCRRIIGNARCCTAIIGQVTPTSCPRNVFIRLAKTPVKPPISNGLTIPCASDVPILFGRRYRSAKSSKNMNVESDSLLITIMQHYQFKLNHYPKMKLKSLRLF